MPSLTPPPPGYLRIGNVNPHEVWSERAVEICNSLMVECGKRDPDAHDLYVYNDFYGYAVTALVEDQMNKLSGMIKKDTDRKTGPGAGMISRGTWEQFEGTVLWLAGEDSYSGIDDGERFTALTGVIGSLAYTMLTSLEPSTAPSPSSSPSSNHHSPPPPTSSSSSSSSPPLPEYLTLKQIHNVSNVFLTISAMAEVFGQIDGRGETTEWEEALRVVLCRNGMRYMKKKGVIDDGGDDEEDSTTTGGESSEASGGEGTGSGSGSGEKEVKESWEERDRKRARKNDRKKRQQEEEVEDESDAEVRRLGKYGKEELYKYYGGGTTWKFSAVLNRYKRDYGKMTEVRGRPWDLTKWTASMKAECSLDRWDI